MESIRLFTGFDPRESVGWHAFVGSLIEQSNDVSLQWLAGEQMDGTNAFTYERFKIMDRCSWAGWAMFLDAADMIVKAPLSELWDLRDARYAVQVVKHDYRTSHPKKYVGTALEAANPDYQRKNWSSAMLINCGHIAHYHARQRIADAIAAGDGKFLHRLAWLADDQIGALPPEWNWLADEYGYNVKAKILHWTAGIPGFNAYRDAPHADEWRATLIRSMRGLQTHELSERSRTVPSER